MEPMIRAVLFDMDGLMFDTERLSIDCWRRAGEHFGYTITPQDVALLRGRNREGGRQAFLKRFGPELPYDKLVEDTHAQLDALLEQDVPVRPGLYELLDFLEKRGTKLAVASSTQSPRVIRNLEKAQVRRYFSAVVGGEQVTRSKPDPEVFLKAAAALGAKPCECMVLEDSANGVRAGHAAGCCTVMVPDLDAPDAELFAAADAIVESLLDVPALLQRLDAGIHAR